MSKAKAAAILALEPAERAVYDMTRQMRGPWQRLSHDEWVDFCGQMGAWFIDSAPDEWDEYVKANKERKRLSDEAAVARRHG